MSWVPIFEQGSAFIGQQTWQGYADWRNEKTGELMFYWVIRRHNSTGSLGRGIIPAEAFTPDDEDERSIDERFLELRGLDPDD